MAGGREDAGLERLGIRLTAAPAKRLWTPDGREGKCQDGSAELGDSCFYLESLRVRLKQSTSPLRLRRLTSVLIYPQLRRGYCMQIGRCPSAELPV